MNHDDPKLTAYALNALPENERAEIETLLKEQPSAATEVAETRDMAGIMRQLFKAELTETLTQRRREAILEAAHGRRVPLTTETPANVVPVSISWWRRTAVWQAAAACAVFGFGVYAISVTLNKPSQSGGLASRPGTAEFQVPLNGLTSESVPATPQLPGVGSPAEGARAIQPGAVADLQNGLKKPAIDAQPSNISGLLQPDISRGLPLQRPTVIAKKEPGREGLPSLDRADIGRKDKRIPGVPAVADGPRTDAPFIGVVNPGEKLILPTDSGEMAITGEEMSRYHMMRDYLNARWQEANSIRETSTYGDLALHFRRDGGSTAPETFRFVMIKCPFIKVDVAFAGEDGKPATWPVAPETRIRSISRPVFEPEQGK